MAKKEEKGIVETMSETIKSKPKPSNLNIGKGSGLGKTEQVTANKPKRKKPNALSKSKTVSLYPNDLDNMARLENTLREISGGKFSDSLIVRIALDHCNKLKPSQLTASIRKLQAEDGRRSK